jgi:hypothetical protein
MLKAQTPSEQLRPAGTEVVRPRIEGQRELEKQVFRNDRSRPCP